MHSPILMLAYLNNNNNIMDAVVFVMVHIVICFTICLLLVL